VKEEAELKQERKTDANTRKPLNITDSVSVYFIKTKSN
jgi:hypothetical protein